MVFIKEKEKKMMFRVFFNKGDSNYRFVTSYLLFVQIMEIEEDSIVQRHNNNNNKNF